MRKAFGIAFNAIVEYLKDDQAHRYGLRKAVRLRVRAQEGEPDVGIYNYKDELLTIESAQDKRSVVIGVEPFRAESGLWNGPDIIPDSLEDGTFEGSLFHDILWGRSKAIAQANGTSEGEVKRWADGILVACMRYYSKHDGGSGLWQRLVYNAVHVGSYVYSDLKKLLSKLFLVGAIVGTMVMLSGCVSGCWTEPGWEVESAPAELEVERGN